MDLYTPPVIITGCRRSGTTLLRAMLGQHAELLVHPKEPQFILEGHDRFGKEVHNIPRAVIYVTDHPYCSDRVTLSNFRDALSGLSTIEYAEFCRHYLRLWGAELLRTRRPVLKDPAWIYRLDLVDEIFPAARVIHVIRDPRGNISSQLARWKKARLWECLQRWQQAIRAGRLWGGSSPDRYRETSYEDLIRSPEATLKPLCDFLHIDFSEGMLQFDLEETLYSPHGAPRSVTFRTVDPSRLDIWREQLSGTEVAIIERQTRAESGYWAFPAMAFQPSAVIVAGHSLRERSFDLVLNTGRWAKGIFRLLKWRFIYR